MVGYLSYCLWGVFDFRPPISVLRFPSSDFRPPSTDLRLPTSDPAPVPGEGFFGGEVLFGEGDLLALAGQE